MSPKSALPQQALVSKEPHTVTRVNFDSPEPKADFDGSKIR